MQPVVESQATQFRRTFSHNLNLLLNRCGCKATGFGRVKEVALMFGISTTSAQHWMTGATAPEMSKLPEVCARLNCTLNELFYGIGHVEQNTNFSSESEMQRIRVLTNNHERSIFVSKELFGTSPWGESACMFQIDDNMMEPFVVGNEYVIFENVVEDEHLAGVYLLNSRGRYVVRRLQETLENTVKVICENHRYPPEIIPRSRIRIAPANMTLVDDSSVTIIGRVTGRVLNR